MATLRAIQQHLDRLEPQVAAAFREAMRGITSNAQIGALEEALRLADIEAAMAALGITGASYVPLTEAMRNAFVASGAFWASDMPRRIGFGFDVNNPRAERWVREHGAAMVARDIQDKRAIIQDTIERGIAAGRHPRSMALDLAGRVSRRTGRRTGGHIVLSEPQSRYVMSAMEELRTGDPNYFTRKKRDRRFDSKVRKAFDGGKPLTDADINKITGRYSDRLLQLRAETIGRTETLAAFNQAGDESLRQLVDGGYVRREDVRKVWDATMDGNTRPDHQMANGQVRGLDETFDVGGVQMLHPHDQSAPPSQTLNCRCFLRQDINFVTEEALRG